jgi:hemerythrin-like domain-containing protein
MWGPAMLDMIKRWIGQEPDSRQMAYLAPKGMPAPRIPRYDSSLIPSLKHDHHNLVEMYEQIGRLAEMGRFRELPATLVAFKTALESHVISENVRFYNYVENSLSGDDENIQLIRSFRKEMNAIARGVVDFVKKYQRYDFDETMRQSFLREYAAVGGLLAQRIQREENNLYPLYQQV